MNKSSAILVVLMATAICVATYFYAHNAGYADGYNRGHDIGYADAQKDYVPPKTYFFEYQNLQNKYNSLVNDYNALARTPKYQPLNCTSTTYGINNQFTSTNCY